MRSTPRRFRASAWIAFSILHPAQAFSKVDPLRLRLASFQSELSEDALAISLGHIMASGASRGGVDANAAPLAWLEQLPGMGRRIAESLVAQREKALLKNRSELSDLSEWESAVQTRQALPFLRIFGSEEPLDGTLIHPDDYPLAKKLATALEIELPPAVPPGYKAPSYEKKADATEPKLVDATKPAEPAPVEDFDHAGEKASEFTLPEETESKEAADDSSSAAEEQSVAESDASRETAEPPAADSAATDSAATDSAATDSAATEEAGTEEPATEVPASEAAATEASGAETHDPVRRPRPERAKIDKCIKEWQIGRHRTNQLVGWLCDPFGETAIAGDPPGVLQTMPTLKTLQPGDQVIGVVVGVMSFGVFVELAPDCSGLIHVSRLSNGYVEDLNEAIQVGDVVTAWVTGIDEKRRRVGLSALSPEQEEKLQQQREQSSTGRGHRGGHGKAGQGRGGQQRGGQQRGGHPQQGAPAGNASGDAAGRAARSGGQAQGKGRGAPAARGGQGGAGQGRGGQGRGGQGRGGQGRGGQGRGGQGRGGQGRGRGARQPESYRVVAKPEAKPISDEMLKGDEPLRSFGDLMQFYSKGDGKETKVVESKADSKSDMEIEAETAPAESKPAESKPADTAKPGADPTATETAGEMPEKTETQKSTAGPETAEQ